MHGEGKKMKGDRAKGRGGRENVFEFYVLLETRYSPRMGLNELQGAGRYAPFTVTVLTALFIYLFQLKDSLVVF